jgi:ATP-dependent RNA helicase DHX57
MVDNLIALKVNDPQADVRESEVIKLVTKLIELDGLDA